MSVLPVKLGLILVLFVPLVLTAQVDAQSPHRSPTVVWQQRFSDRELDWDLRSVAMSGAKSFAGVVLRQRRSNVRGTTPRPLWLWQLNETGDRVNQVELPMAGDGRVSEADILDMKRLSRGELAILAEGNGWFVVTVDTTLKLSRPTPIASTSESALQPRRIVPTTDGAFVVVGSSGGGAWCAKMDETRGGAWRDGCGGGEKGEFVDGAAARNGEVILVGTSVTSRPDVKPSETLIAAYDRQGKLVRERRFPGSSPSISGTGEGVFVVSYDARVSTGQDIWVRGFDERLEQQWQTHLVAVDYGLLPFGIAPGPKGGFVVAGSQNLHLWAAGLSSAGQVIWTMTDAERKSGRFDIASSDGGKFVIGFNSTAQDQVSGKVFGEVSLVAFLQK